MLFKTKRSAKLATSGGGGGSDDGEAAMNAHDKAQIRRAQVRRAQIQHRQRKANYIRQLELDIAGIHELISRTSRECSVMRQENETMRAHLTATAAAGLSPAIVSPPSFNTDTLFGDIDISDITMMLEMDEVLGIPAYRVSSYSPSSQSGDAGSSPRSPQSEGLDDSSPIPALQDMTPEQTHQAINFILA